MSHFEVGKSRAGQLPAFGVGGSALLFGAAALLLFFTTRVFIPALILVTGAEPVLLWFLAASTAVFGPLLLIATWMLHRESRSSSPVPWLARLRLRSMGRQDWWWSVGALGIVGLLTGGIATVLRGLVGRTGLHPTFMAFEPLTRGRYWVLGAWLPFFVLNILARSSSGGPWCCRAKRSLWEASPG